MRKRVNLKAGAHAYAEKIHRIQSRGIAVYGVFIAPIGWKNAAFIWAYAFGAFFITDWIKVVLYKLLVPVDLTNSRLN